MTLPQPPEQAPAQSSEQPPEHPAARSAEQPPAQRPEHPAEQPPAQSSEQLAEHSRAHSSLHVTDPASEKPPADLTELKRVSARIGSDPMLVQSAGGNTSVKGGDLMWIKASGTLLEDALDKDIFVAVDLPRLRAAILQADPIADQPQNFLLNTGNTLRPSIETSLHAIFTQRIVLHVHCIHTLAHAVLADGGDLLQTKLAGLKWVRVPYARPGAELAKAVADALTPDSTIVVLANHGLLVAGESVDDALAQVLEVHRRLAVEAGPFHEPDLERLESLAADSAYRLPVYLPAHQLALVAARVRQATTGSLYPDHVIFCGIAVHVLADGDNTTELERRCASNDQTAPVFMLVPGAGVLVRRDASSGALALIRCLADVLLRVPGDARLSYLSDAQNAELLNWDAEKYRQSLNV